MPTKTGRNVQIVIVWMGSYDTILIESVVFVVAGPGALHFDRFEAGNSICWKFKEKFDGLCEKLTEKLRVLA